MQSKALYPSMFDSVVGSLKSNLLVNTLAVFMGSLLIVLGAQIYITLPFTPVPITGQTLSVLVVGSLLGSSRAPLSVLLYILYGAIGFPVFSENSGGIQFLMGATGGYIFGFILCAYIVGKFTEKGWDRILGKSLFAMLLGQFLIFAPGLLWLSQYVGFENVLEKGFYPFVLGGVIKTLLAGSSSVLVWKLIEKLKGGR
jgi:biotin transporter BioY